MQLAALAAHLERYSAADWAAAVEVLSASSHEIDRNATRIWFSFFPLSLHLALAGADDPAAVVRRLELMGRWRLADQIDSSHRFLYSHRYWPQVKSAVQSHAGAAPEPLAA